VFIHTYRRTYTHTHARTRSPLSPPPSNWRFTHQQLPELQIAGDALKGNITTLGPLVLPLSEQLFFLLNALARKALGKRLPLPPPVRGAVAAATAALLRLSPVAYAVGLRPPTSAIPRGGAGSSPPRAPPRAAATTQGEAAARPPASPPTSPSKARGGGHSGVELRPYVPDFTKAFEWICVHTGGRAVIDAIESNLALPPHYLEPSRLSLWKYGNVSSASIWYELDLVAEHGNTCGEHRPDGTPPPGGAARRLRRGDRVWQIAFGSGFKCNSAVWQALRHH